MDVARWKKIKEIAGEAMDRPPADRPGYVASACAGDAELAAEVESLLEHDRHASRFPDSAAVMMEREDGALAGQEAGPYRLLEEIGHGGMGTVYLAERVDGAYRQRVAVKVIRRGMDTEHVLRRFRTERQILATLNHPNIARLLDGGALPDGRPYLVMEHVSARRIDRYCDEEQLGVADRIRLFLQVCDAVSFAHQRLVVHRDIKPANVLVDASGTPKLLDFGIAKLLGPELDDDAPATDSVLRPMTPDYASPEQIAGQPVTTTTDALSLYEAISQSLPGDADAQRDLAIGHRNVGKALVGLGDPRSAMPHLRRALELMKEVVTRSPDSAFLARQLAFTHLVMADALTAAEPARSLDEMKVGIRIGESLVNKDASNMVALRTLAMSYAQAGRAAEALAKRDPARWREAREWYVRSRDAWRTLAKRGEIAANAKQVLQVHEAITRCNAAMASLAR